MYANSCMCAFILGGCLLKQVIQGSRVFREFSQVFPLMCKRGQWESLFWQLHSLGHQGESFSAHGWTWHQLDHHVFAGGLKVNPRHLLQHGGQGGHIASLCAGVSARCIQDVPPVHHQQQHVRLTFSLQKGSCRVEKETLKRRYSEGGKIAAFCESNAARWITGYFYMFLAAGKYTDRLFVMILPLCPPVLQCCSEGDSVGCPAGRDPLYWMSKRVEAGSGSKEGKGEKWRETKGEWKGHSRSHFTQLHH